MHSYQILISTLKKKSRRKAEKDRRDKDEERRKAKEKRRGEKV